MFQNEDSNDCETKRDFIISPTPAHQIPAVLIKYYPMSTSNLLESTEEQLKLA